MRSIGKVKIKKLHRIIDDNWTAFRLGNICPGMRDIDFANYIIDNYVPVEWQDIWESAHDEIHRIVFDSIYKKTSLRGVL